MRMTLFLQTYPWDFSTTVPAQPLIAGTTVKLSARLGNRATLKFIGPLSRGHFVLGSTAKGVLGTTKLGSGFEISHLDKVVVQSLGTPAGQVFVGYVVDVDQEIDRSLPAGKCRYTLQCRDGGYFLERDFVQSLSLASVGVNPSDKETIEYILLNLLNSNASGAVGFLAASIDTITDPLPASIDDSWSFTSAKRIMDDITKGSGGVWRLDQAGLFKYNNEANADDAPFQLNLDTPAPASDDYLARPARRKTSAARLATIVTVVGAGGSSVATASDTAIFGPVRRVEKDSSVTSVAEAQDVADAMLAALKEPTENYEFSFFNGVKDSRSNVSWSSGWLDAGQLLTVTFAAFGLQAEALYLEQVDITQLSDTVTEFRVSTGPVDTLAPMLAQLANRQRRVEETI